MTRSSQSDPPVESGPPLDADLATAVLEAPDAEVAERLIRDAEPQACAALVETLAQEVLRLLRVDARQALAIAELEAAAAARSGEVRLSARALWSRGHALVNLARPAEAADHYGRAARAYRELGEPVLAARTALGHVDALMYLGRYEEALAIGKKAEAVLTRHGAHRALIGLETNLANILHRTDRPAAALAAYDRALRAARQLDDGARIRWIQFNRANVLVSLGRYSEAESRYLDVRAGAVAAGESQGVALVDYSLGYLRLERCDYEGAYAALDAARTGFEELGDTHNLALCHLDLAELLIEINNFARSQHQSRLAQDLFGSLGLRYEHAKATLLQGIAALGQGENRRASELLAEAAAEFGHEGNGVSEAACELYMGEIDRRIGRHREAEARLARAERCFEREGWPLRQAAAALRRARLAIGRGKLAPTRRHIERARRLIHRRPAPWLAAQLDHLKGRCHVLEGEPGKALRSVRRAVRGIETIRGRIGSDEFRLSFAADKAPIYADLVELILRTRSGDRAVREAFEVAEQARSRALVDLLAGRLGAVEGRLGPEGQALMRKLDRLRGELSWLVEAGHNRDRPPEAWRLGSLSGSLSGTESLRRPAGASPSLSLLRAREHEMADLMQRISRRHRRLGALTAGETIGLDEVQAHLDDQTVLIEYFLGRERARAFVIRRDAARVVDLPAAAGEIGDTIERLRFQIEKWGYGEEYVRGREGLLLTGARHHLNRLAEMCWAPLGVDSPRILVVPHGPLHSLPFQALPLGNGHDLVDRSEVTYLPSASALRYLRGDPARARRRAGRVAEDDGDSMLLVGVEDRRIPKVREEVERVRDLFPRHRILRDDEATIEAFSALAADADYVHVATHGIFRQDDPSFSALRLADGWLSLYDTYGLRLRAKLVSLSTCQSGRSWVGGGDEMVGLARGFLYAGARSLLVSLWPVNDSTAADLAATFYRALREGSPPRAALRAAMQEVRATHPHPYHWAPFVLIGAGQG